MDKEAKTEIIEKFKLHKGDSGSADVQAALLTGRIKQLTGHLAVNRHDFGTQRTLLKLVGRRRRLLVYLSKNNIERYRNLISALGLRK